MSQAKHFYLAHDCIFIQLSDEKLVHTMNKSINRLKKIPFPISFLNHLVILVKLSLTLLLEHTALLQILM